ncbi:hypothetical protein PIB30_012007 [Stylosanthes scabra]|uniref:Secreted protein n=1 Tax=Stylosanthes scabra TaxID=79078 RepID=A0ABU6Y651_9FABA|nr:hypothetical protein [Stylosanthes scabra]
MLGSIFWLQHGWLLLPPLSNVSWDIGAEELTILPEVLIIPIPQGMLPLLQLRCCCSGNAENAGKAHETGVVAAGIRLHRALQCHTVKVQLLLQHIEPIQGGEILA